MLSACAESPPPFEPTSVAVPSAAGAKGPRISGSLQQGLILSWMEADDSGAALHYSRWSDGQWSEPQTIVENVDMFVNWADMPSVQPMGENTLAAHWLEMSADLTYSYDVVFVQSADGGGTWSEPLRPHDDGTPTEHGFVSMFADESGTGLIWLDGRKTGNEKTGDPADTGMTLRAATIGGDSTLQDEQLVDELICDCCQTDIAIASSGAVAVYRDRSPDEIRDISVTRRIDGRWTPGRPIAADNWEIPGCPVNGPAIVAAGEFVAVAWFTGAGGHPLVKLAMSSDSGATFAAPIEVAAGATQGRVGLALLDNGDVAVSWLQSGESGTHPVFARRYSAAGAPGPARLVTPDAAAFSFPQIALSGDDLVFVWTETEAAINSLHSARVAAAAL
ncbi:MAG: sialidase family protein [Woeseiaceae bacterium]|nr:sialidase family protein [Woeseiaceae bacterium]